MSSNRAWMPLHIGDYLKDTGHLNAAEHGAYMLMIMHYWQHGALPADERLIARIAKLSPNDWAESRDVLAMLFGPGWTHKRIDAELSKADEIIEKRRAAAQGRHAKSKADASAVHVHSKSTDTGVPPRTNNQDTPPNPQGGEAADLYGELLSIYPASVHTKPDRAERQFFRLSLDLQRLAVSQAKSARTQSEADRQKRGRDAATHAEFVQGLDGWLRDGAWKTVAAPVPIVPMTKLDRERDADLWRACERIMGRPAPTSDLAWSFPNSVIEQARAAA